MVKRRIFFFNLTIESPERPRCCHSAVFIGNPVHVLEIAYWDFQNPTVYV